MMRIAFVALLLVVFAGSARAEDRIAATVNDAVVTVRDVEHRVMLYLSGAATPPTPEQRQAMTRQVLDKLIDETLQVQEAKKMDIVVGDDDVAQGFADIARQNNLTPEAFRQRLQAGGVDVESLNAQIRADLAWMQVVRRKLRPQVNVSENDIDLTLDQISRGKTYDRLAEIFLPVSSPAEDAAVKEKITDLARQIENGAPFAMVAREFSQAPGAAAGGDRGWIEQGQLEPALEEARARLKLGEMSAPVRGDKGYSLLVLVDRRAGGADLSADAPTPSGPIVALRQLFLPFPAPVTEAAAQKTLEHATLLRKKISSCAAMEQAMKKHPSPQTRDLGQGPQDALPPDLRSVVARLGVEEPSPPLRMDSGVLLVMVCSRTVPDSAPVAGSAPPPDRADAETRDKIASKLGLTRLDRMATRYLQDLRATAFIDKRI